MATLFHPNSYIGVDFDYFGWAIIVIISHFLTGLPTAKRMGRTHCLASMPNILKPVYTQAVLHDNPKSRGDLEISFNKTDISLGHIKYSESSKCFHTSFSKV